MSVITPELEQESRLGQDRVAYNPVASIDMLRGDLRQHGTLLPETLQRMSDEELSLIAEGIDRPMVTSFTLQEKDGALVYFDKGEWRPYVSTFLSGLRSAEAKSSEDPRAEFLVSRAIFEWQEGKKLEALNPGESLVVCSSFPHEVAEKYGRRFMMKEGFWPGRDMGFIRVSTKNHDGSATITSTSVDRSDKDAFREVLVAAGAILPENLTTDEMLSFQPIVEADETLPETLRSIYDASVSRKLGQECFAGRTSLDKQNSWQLLHQQTDLLAYFKDEIINLAHSDLYGRDLEDAKKTLTYGVWAAIKGRIDTTNMPGVAFEHAENFEPDFLRIQLAQEIAVAFDAAKARGDILLACGGSIGNILDAEASDVRDMIFGDGNKTGEDKFGSLQFKCQKGHLNTRPRNKLIEKCTTCGTSVKC